MNACYFAPSANFATNVFCQQIIRAHDTQLGPIIKQINFPTFNLGSVKTSGVDGAFTYGFDLGDLDASLENAGSWATTLDINYLNSYSTDPGVAGTVPVPGAGSEGLPHFRGLLRTTFTLQPVEVTTTMHYVGGLYVDKSFSWDCSTSPCTRITPIMNGNAIPAQWTMDLHVSYDLNKIVQLYVGANNVFDTRAPVVYPGSGYDTTGTGTDANTYDPIGLYLYGGVHFKM
jgi:outer membrane receptor protein involved in Fe transport